MKSRLPAPRRHLVPSPAPASASAPSLTLGLAFLMTLAMGLPTPGASHAANLRDEVAVLAESGRLDSALTRVQASEAGGKGEDGVTPREKSLLLGKLHLRGEISAKHLLALKAEGQNSPEQAEALYLLGQYHYAAGRYQLAIPEFREYLKRYPEGEDADRAAYWMGNACLHLALTQPERGAYLDTGLAYLARMPARKQLGAYYAALAAECAARLHMAKGQGQAADSVLLAAMQAAPGDEKPALLLLQAQWLRARGQSQTEQLETLQRLYPNSPEAAYVRRLKHQLPAWSPVLRSPSRGDSSQAAATGTTTAPTPTPRVTPPSPTKATGRFTLQVGSFAQLENAQTLADQLKRKGLPAELETVRHGQHNLTQVLVGRFTDAATAEAFGAEQLKPRQILFQVRSREPGP